MDNFFIRASSLSEIFDCPARWEAKYLLGMRSPSGVASHLGTSIHASTAVFDKTKLDGSPVTVDEAVGALVDTLYDKNAEVDWTDSDITIGQAEEIGKDLHTRYCQTIAPTQEYVGVEVACNNLTISMPDVQITLTGTTDRVRRNSNGKLGIADLKSGKTAVAADGTVNASKHGAQLGVYELLVEHAIGESVTEDPLIIGLQVAKTDKGRRVGTGTAKATRDVLVGNHDEPGLLDHAAKVLKGGLFYGNPRSQMCSQKYCPRYAVCKWRF